MNNEERLFKASILLGIALGGIKSMHSEQLDDDDAASIRMRKLIRLLEKGIDEIFYQKNQESIE